MTIAKGGHSLSLKATGLGIDLGKNGISIEKN